MERTVLKHGRFCFLVLLSLMMVFLLETVGIQSLWAEDTNAVSISSTDEDDGEDDAFMSDLLNETGGATTESEPVSAESSFPLRFEGELITSLWIPTHDTGEDTLTSNRLNLKTWGDMGDLSVHGELKLDYQDLEGEDKARADLRELYASYRFRSRTGAYMDLALGKKILYWGKSDEIRPLDRICAQDYTSYLFYDINDRKTGRVGAFMTMDAGEYVRFEGFWSPYFEASKTPGSNDYFEPAALKKLRLYGVDVENDDSGDWSEDAGYGGRLMLSLFKVDMALYAYRGYDSQPVYGVSKLGLDSVYGLPVVPETVSAVYPRMALYGFDIERAIGDVVVRAETAYQDDGALFNLDFESDPTVLLTNPTGLVEKRQIQAIAGLDKNDFLVRNLFLNLQYFHERIFDYDPLMTVPETRTGMTAYLRYTFFDSKCELKYRGTFVFRDNDHRQLVEAAYKPWPMIQLAVGGVVFDGDDPVSTFGQYDDEDYVYGKMKVVF